MFVLLCRGYNGYITGPLSEWHLQRLVFASKNVRFEMVWTCAVLMPGCQCCVWGWGVGGWVEGWFHLKSMSLKSPCLWSFLHVEDILKKKFSCLKIWFKLCCILFLFIGYGWSDVFSCGEYIVEAAVTIAYLFKAAGKSGTLRNHKQEDLKPCKKTSMFWTRTS